MDKRASNVNIKNRHPEREVRKVLVHTQAIGRFKGSDYGRKHDTVIPGTVGQQSFMTVNFHPLEIKRTVSHNGERALLDLDCFIDMVAEILVFKGFNRFAEAFKFEALDFFIE